MKLIMAIIRQEKLDPVKKSLEEKANITSMTITNVKGRGKQQGIKQSWRGEEYQIEFLPKTKLEIVVPEDKTEEVTKIIQENAKTGSIGDGKIFILPVNESIRIRTGEKGKNSL